ncbi:hypothetical protein GCM10011380_17510 [Sphingomonas metalli]|uniref:MlaB-like STAS domain-containing protein n=1 Tax=Sphingomonas metalli TaxID=1779358 RepID=A0A916T335_9SPHN|nr:STAS domain-containing protein [Sphingomonas metalli]GGB28405.1 hypothetical protein GCM10011380_17510 [Sphingomonas metalli]
MSSTTVMAAENLCLPTIETLADALRAALSPGRAVRLDLSAVAAPDLSVLQLVQSARVTAARDGCGFALAVPATGSLAALLDRAGFPPAFTPEDRQFWFHGDTVQ